jgi:Tol biopolymer transport system component
MSNFIRAAAILILSVAAASCGDDVSIPAGHAQKAKTFSLVAPADGAGGVALQPSFEWTCSTNAQSYHLQVAATADFAAPVIDVAELQVMTYSPATPLNAGTTYWWKVEAAVGATRVPAAGAPASFTTEAPAPSLRRVAFQSDATTLVAGDTNGRTDMFVRDIVTGTTTRASVSSTGNQLFFGDAAQGAMTPDGKFLAFQYGGSDLIPGQNGSRIYVRDLDTGTVEVSPPPPDPISASAPTISADGRMVAFHGFSFTNSNIYVWDRQTGTLTNISLTPSGAASTSGNCFSPALSGNGRYVAFESFKNDLVLGGTNGVRHIFVRDLQTNLTEQVSRSSAGVQGNANSTVPAISADGRFVAFPSAANNLVSNDLNGVVDIFVRDRQTGTTEIVSVSTGGDRANTNGGDEPQPPSISADGRYVVFEHAASNLVTGDTNGTYDIFVRDRQLGTTQRISLSSAGVEGNGSSRWASIYPGGRFVAFASEASNLVTGDTNGVADIFLHDLTTGTTTRLSVATDGTQADGPSNVPVASSP